MIFLVYFEVLYSDSRRMGSVSQIVGQLALTNVTRNSRANLEIVVHELTGIEHPMEILDILTNLSASLPDRSGERNIKVKLLVCLLCEQEWSD